MSLGMRRSANCQPIRCVKFEIWQPAVRDENNDYCIVPYGSKGFDTFEELFDILMSKVNNDA